MTLFKSPGLPTGRNVGPFGAGRQRRPDPRTWHQNGIASPPSVCDPARSRQWIFCISTTAEEIEDADRLRIVTAVVRQASQNAFEHLMGNAAIADVEGWDHGSRLNEDDAMNDDVMSEGWSRLGRPRVADWIRAGSGQRVPSADCNPT